MLQQLNTWRMGYLSLGFGAVSFAALGKLLIDPTYLVALYGAIIRGSQHVETQADIFTIAQLVAAIFGIIGSFVLAYLARPRTV